jgi:hypothetical protein
MPRDTALKLNHTCQIAMVQETVIAVVKPIEVCIILGELIYRH